ncbi:UDP-N-acetylglucosamine--N-acetylmuramyl-(pentapeptide) pyrophosphoryl-undecaprenol N-acetylglucosamine transferase [Jeotgalicoccus saudimassiliensis]|uniref:UDP-N-acetylglucosamine--N-acetylmuramyl-(pentapeptide) pyrophosphoryl-undecaprenol N-acetylglucosamine transferase n=1 Tax=Jeotgalicoccus saudimassiliensis TaxID=1461582 RepID=A0A078M267_9STAP|nr:undecaprenyldiphospho-muramoylpentapeptide beta-N-acetylglucosaminyltransferase [Jeotgalicoccus saudimassiliensis]CEA00280.1 UDP-N-acetylglucosamine--N-acetylmuramyl-(pentapeptide) pyrophosphoryl-undecaprenol N-acetylglucosamine transferase [Jeotgalicoccus saudimassiliensis]
MVSDNKKVMLTGGGTVGHVMLNKLLIPELQNKNIEPHYIGSKNGIEKDIIADMNIPYHSISSGKLRRYISFENLKDIFKVVKGVLDAKKILKREKPLFVFSKGGFVSVPVVLAAAATDVPVYIHESDLTPGLANRIASKFATKVFTTFEATTEHFTDAKAEYLGPAIRPELTQGSHEEGYALTGFNSAKPVLIVMGGSLGAKKINEFIHSHIDTLTEKYQIIHLTGKGNVNKKVKAAGYKQFDYVGDELAHLLAISDIVISRSGSNAIFELLHVKKPMVLIPLGLDQSRGDQIQNAKHFKKQGYAEVLKEEDLNLENLGNTLDDIDNRYSEITYKMTQFKHGFHPDELAAKLIGEASQSEQK